MKKFFYALAGVLVVASVRLLGEARSLQSGLSERWEDFDRKQLKSGLRQLSQKAGKVDTAALRDQLASLASTADQVRSKEVRKQVKGLQQAVKELDLAGIRQQAEKLSTALATAPKAAPRRSRRWPYVLAALVVGGGAVAFAASRRREMVTGQLGGLQDARSRLPGPLGRTTGGQDEQQLKAAVEQALHSAAPAIAPDVRVEVEGRTVYLRGSTGNRELLEAGIRRAQEVTGVAAVINLVALSAPARTNNGEQATPASGNPA